MRKAPFPLAPWHMWGSTAPVNVTTTSGNPVVGATQLARIDYRRPENWRFLLTGRLMGGDPSVVGPTDVYAAFDLFTGVGRTVLDTTELFTTIANLRAFAIFHWLVPIGVVPGQQPGNVKYAVAVDSPLLDDTDATSSRLIDHFPAQSITCRVQVITAGDPGLAIHVEVGSYFAPNVHVRPDWYDDDNLFRGNETGGT